MSVSLEFIHLFIPMRLIDEQYPGGWPAWKIHNSEVIGASAWFDEHLYTQGAMNGADIDSVAHSWKQLFPAVFHGAEPDDHQRAMLGKQNAETQGSDEHRTREADRVQQEHGDVGVSQDTVVRPHKEELQQ